MIDIKELRTGNIVKGLKKYYKVELLDDEEGSANIRAWRINKDNEAFSITDFEINPIPLTDEIFLKCGFIKDISYKKGRIDIWYSHYNKCYVFRFGHDSETPIKYLHTLQNFYELLERKELEIKL